MKAKQATLPVEPEVGAFVRYRDARYGTAGHTGQFLARSGATWRVRTLTGVKRVDVQDVEGYWPKGLRKHDPARMVRVNQASRSVAQ